MNYILVSLFQQLCMRPFDFAGRTNLPCGPQAGMPYPTHYPYPDSTPKPNPNPNPNPKPVHVEPLQGILAGVM